MAQRTCAASDMGDWLHRLHGAQAKTAKRCPRVLPCHVRRDKKHFNIGQRAAYRRIGCLRRCIYRVWAAWVVRYLHPPAIGVLLPHATRRGRTKGAWHQSGTDIMRGRFLACGRQACGKHALASRFQRAQCPRQMGVRGWHDKSAKRIAHSVTPVRCATYSSAADMVPASVAAPRIIHWPSLPLNGSVALLRRPMYSTALL